MYLGIIYYDTSMFSDMTAGTWRNYVNLFKFNNLVKVNFEDTEWCFFCVNIQMVVLEKFSFLSAFIESEKKQRNYEMRVSIPIAWKFAGCYKWKCNGRNVIIKNKVILNKSVLGDHYCFH